MNFGTETEYQKIEDIDSSSKKLSIIKFCIVIYLSVW